MSDSDESSSDGSDQDDSTSERGSTVKSSRADSGLTISYQPAAARDSNDSNLSLLEKFADPQPSQPMAGESLREGQILFDRFEINKRLGRGGFGTVYSAFDRKLDRTVAIKQARSLKSFVAGQVREEARKIASLNHPNIVQIYDLIEHGENELLIVMEYLEGVSLSTKLKSDALSITDAVRMAVDVCEALVHAHERQLIHSDLKPANLYVCRDGRIKLLDFGLAVAHFPDQETRIGGTPGYMSPEQIRGESHLIDGRTDLWAFGVVLYEMLTRTATVLDEKCGIDQRENAVQTRPPAATTEPGYRQ